MKPLFFATVMVAFTTSLAIAQPAKKSFLVSANASYWWHQSIFVNDPDVVEEDFRATSSIGYFLSNRFVVGLTVPSRFNTVKIENGPKSSQSSIAGGAFIRYYQPFSKKFFGVLHGGYTLGKEKRTSYYTTMDGTFKRKETEPLRTHFIGGGFSYFVNKNVGFDLMVVFSADADTEQDRQLNMYTLDRYVTFGASLLF